jgi:AraC family transcriptional regulator of adaptative response / methylphosphotriester-DNA alkyltransferase methyltransferase
MIDGERSVNPDNGGEIRAEKARKAIEGNYRTIEGIESLCMSLGISPKVLRECFFFAYHATPKRYLDNVRVTRAKELLVETPMKVYEIGIEVGFRSMSGFERTFTRLVGVCPSRFRREALSKTRDENEVRKCGAKTPNKT